MSEDKQRWPTGLCCKVRERGLHGVRLVWGRKGRVRNGSASDRMETYGSVKVRLKLISGMWRLSGMVVWIG